MQFSSTPTLAVLCERGHANNFNLVRLMAALLVVVAHSAALTGGAALHVGASEVELGRLAVDVFFLTSGFLVTKSLLVRRSVVDFLVARVIRIYPGLIVMTTLTVLVAAVCQGPAFLGDPGTWRYFTSTAFLSLPKLAVFDLPGVFMNNPIPRAVNGSLWTLPYELRMYTLLAAMWLGLLLIGRARPRFVVPLLAFAAAVAAAAFAAKPDSNNAGFGFMFFTGASYYGLRRFVPMRADLAWGAAAVLAASSLWPSAFSVAYPLLLGYVLFAVSYLPALWRPRSDCSYGAYIYAFPIQQTIVLLWPGVSAPAMTALAIPLVLIAAAASWHWVEKPAMRWKARLTARRGGGNLEAAGPL